MMWYHLKRCSSNFRKRCKPILLFLGLCTILLCVVESHRSASKFQAFFLEDSTHGAPNEWEPSMKAQVREEPNDIHDCSVKRSDPKWDSSKNIPQWMKNHFAWHSERRCLDGLDGSNSSETKYFVMQCLQRNRKCGGISDRLKPLALAVLFANMTNRVLLFHWERPCALEEFLVPTENGIDWRFPEWLESDREISRFHVTSVERMMENIKSESRIITATFQLWDGGSEFFNENAGADFNSIYSEIFHAVFEPTHQLSEEISSTMDSLGLTPFQYAAAHVRAKYPGLASYVRERNPGSDENLKGEDGKTLDEKEGKLVLAGKTKDHIIKASTNAVYCALKIFPEAKKVYFSSDSYQTNEYMLKDSEFSKESSPLEVVAYQHDDEPLHLDSNTHKNKAAALFFPAFTDLFILSLSKCLSLGMGGYGRFASLIRVSVDGSCANQHTNYRGRIYICPKKRI